MSVAASRPHTINVLGINVFVGDLRGGAELVVSRAQARSGGYVCLCNVHVLMSSQRDEQLRIALDRADAVFADGAPIAWLQRRLGETSARRVGGPDLMPLVINQGQTVGLRHFFLGSSPAVVERLKRRIEARFPGALIVGSYAPPLGPVPEAAVERIRETEPAIVWCSLGAPKQELWMRAHVDRLGPSLLIGVGAAFDFLSETKRRAPVWMQRTGFEWLHRFGTEPKRLARRYLATNTRFVFAATREVTRR